MVKNDVEATKAALWRRLFGADLSPSLVSTLFYVDVQDRLIKLTGGGWVRDAGDKIFASGAEPEVVALMVAAAQAKGWAAVRVWGPPEFIAECRRQFGEAGIPVSVDGEPPKMIVPDHERTHSPAPENTAEVIAQFRRRVEYADRQLEDIRTPGSSGKDVAEAEAAARAAEAAWREALAKEKHARLARKQAKKVVSEAGFFARARARYALQEAEALLASAEESLNNADETHQEKQAHLIDTRKEAMNRERCRRAKLEPEERNAEARRQFALECLQTLEQHPDLAAQGIDAVEKATEERLARAAADAEASVDATSKP